MQIFTRSVSKYSLVLDYELPLDQIILASAGAGSPSTLKSKKLTMVIHEDVTFSPAALDHDAPSPQAIVPPPWINHLAVRRLMKSTCLAKGRKACQMSERSPSVTCHHWYDNGYSPLHQSWASKAASHLLAAPQTHTEPYCNHPSRRVALLVPSRPSPATISPNKVRGWQGRAVAIGWNFHLLELSRLFDGQARSDDCLWSKLACCTHFKVSLQLFFWSCSNLPQNLIYFAFQPSRQTRKANLPGSLLSPRPPYVVNDGAD